MRSHPIALLLVVLIRVYQAFSLAIHRILGIPDNGGCRFDPTCSEYTVQSIKQYGALKGTWMGIKRVSKCHPFYNPKTSA